MFRNNFTTWPLKARVLWMVALAIEASVAISAFVLLAKHLMNALFSFTMAILMFVALTCQMFAMDIRGWKQETGHENTLQDKQE